MIQKWQVGFVFIIMNLGIAFFLYDKLVYLSTSSGHWEVVFFQCLLQFFLIWLYIKGLRRFPQKDVIDIYLIVGRWLGVTVSILFIAHMIIYILLNNRAHSEILEFTFLPRTPYWAIMSLLLFVSTYAAIKGLHTILRCSVFIFLLVIPCLMFILCTSISRFDIHNASPIWNVSFDYLFNRNFPPILGISAFLFLGFIPSEIPVKFNQIVMPWFCVLLIFLSIVYMPLLIYGQESVVKLFLPFVDATGSIEVSWFPFKRATLFLGISLVAFGILYNALLLWVIGHFIQKITGCQNTKVTYSIITFSLVVYISALFIPNWAWIEKLLKWNSIAHLCAMVLIPITIYFISVLYKKEGIENEKR